MEDLEFHLERFNLRASEVVGSMHPVDMSSALVQRGDVIGVDATIHVSNELGESELKERIARLLGSRARVMTINRGKSVQ